ncbi:MAG: hypothetical protein DDT21_02759 [Syntrophomonadaceae bacterium]|nr:hypothetical protein [Bacillota bacterium]
MTTGALFPEMEGYDLNQLPKGMVWTLDKLDIKKPTLVFLRHGNYVAAIYQALDTLPVNIRILQCRVTERENVPAEIELTLQILDEKETEGSGPEISD